MQTKTPASLLEGTTVNPTNENDPFKVNQFQNLNTQVKAATAKQKIIRRKFSRADKLKTLETFDACNDSSERGAFLRKEGLYNASILKWRKELSEKNSSYTDSKAYKLTLPECSFHVGCYNYLPKNSLVGIGSDSPRQIAIDYWENKGRISIQNYEHLQFLELVVDSDLIIFSKFLE